MVKPQRPNPASFACIRKYCRAFEWLGDPIARDPSGEVIVEIVERPKTHSVAGFLGGAAQMRQQKSVGQGAIPRIDIGLVIEDIEPDGREVARRERRNERVIVDYIAARGVYHDCAMRQSSQCLGVD